MLSKKQILEVGEKWSAHLGEVTRINGLRRRGDFASAATLRSGLNASLAESFADDPRAAEVAAQLVRSERNPNTFEVTRVAKALVGGGGGSVTTRSRDPELKREEALHERALDRVADDGTLMDDVITTFFNTKEEMLVGLRKACDSRDERAGAAYARQLSAKGVKDMFLERGVSFLSFCNDKKQQFKNVRGLKNLKPRSPWKMDDNDRAKYLQYRARLVLLTPPCMWAINAYDAVPHDTKEYNAGDLKEKILDESKWMSKMSASDIRAKTAATRHKRDEDWHRRRVRMHGYAGDMKNKDSEVQAASDAKWQDYNDAKSRAFASLSAATLAGTMTHLDFNTPQNMALFVVAPLLLNDISLRYRKWIKGKKRKGELNLDLLYDDVRAAETEIEHIRGEMKRIVSRGEDPLPHPNLLHNILKVQLTSMANVLSKVVQSLSTFRVMVQASIEARAKERHGVLVRTKSN